MGEETAQRRKQREGTHRWGTACSVGGCQPESESSGGATGSEWRRATTNKSPPPPRPPRARRRARPSVWSRPGTPGASRAPREVRSLGQPTEEKLDPWRGGHPQSREAAQESHGSCCHREWAKPQHPKVPAETEKPSHQSKRVMK